MSKTTAASKKATTKKTTAEAVADNAGQAATPAETEPKLHIVVLPQEDGSLVKLGAMLCGPGARGVMPESQARTAEEQGWVKIIGLAL